jgi:hypothetical protein
MRGPKLCLPRAPGILQVAWRNTGQLCLVRVCVLMESTPRKWRWYWTVLKYLGRPPPPKSYFPMDT